MLDYSGCVLYNWALLDEKGPVSTDNARMLRRFTGIIRGVRDCADVASTAWTSVLFCATAWRRETRAATPSSRCRVDGVEGDRRERLVGAVDATRDPNAVAPTSGAAREPHAIEQERHTPTDTSSNDLTLQTQVSSTRSGSSKLT